MNFSEISRYHECAAAVLENGIIVRRIKSSTIALFDEAIRMYAMELRDSKIVDPPWEQLLITMRRANRMLSESPIAPSLICASLQSLMEELKPQIKMRKATLTVDLQFALDSLVEAYLAVKTETTHPVAQYALDLLKENITDGKTALVVHRHSTFNQAVSDLLQIDSFGGAVTLVSPKAVSINQPVDLMIFFGPPIVFQYRGESCLFQAPTAPDLHFLQFEHLSTGEVSSGLLSERKKLHASVTGDPKVDAGDTLESIHIPPPPTFQRKTSPWLPELSVPKGERENIKAIRVVLGGHKGIHLDANGSVYQVIAKRRDGGVECDSIHWMKVEKLEIGDAIVVTTDGAGDMIRPYADLILGYVATKLRKMQVQWKEELQKLVDVEGLQKACKVLRDAGCKRANSGNVRNWMGPFNIAPSDLMVDFANLLRCVGLSSQVADFVDCVEQIRTAHRKAGLALQSNLLKALKGKSVNQLYSQGFLRFRAEQGGPSKTVFLIEAIDPEPCLVSQSAINHVVDLEQDSE